MKTARIAPILAAAVLLGLVAGCSSASKAHLVRVTRAEAPAVTTGRVTPRLSEDDPRSPWIIAPPGSFTDEKQATYVAAREAFWNYDLEKTAELLHKVHADGILKDPSFYYLLLTCYERSGRWADTLPLYERFGITESHRGWKEVAETFARFPTMAVDFANDAPPLAFNLKYGDLVIAEVTVNGTPARVLLDTGANMTWWSRSFARRAGLQSLDVTVSLGDANASRRKTDLVLMRELKLGALTVRDAPTIAGRAWLVQFMLGIDGIVGWDVLQHAHLVFDFPARRLTIARPSEPIPDAPLLSGRVEPILTVRSSEGVPLHLFLDSGATSNKSGVALYTNEGAIETKVAVREFRRGWRPSFSLGMHSLSVAWPLRVKPFSFWMDGHRFETQGASLADEMHIVDDFAYYDGLVGLGPFLGGKLTLCGMRRIVKFEPGVPPP